MIILFICLIIIVVKSTIITNNKDYMKREYTKRINGVFVIFVFYSHFITYIEKINNWDYFIKAVVFLIGQLMVAPFLFYSGYGIAESIKAKGDKYKKDFFKNRFIPTYRNFFIALVLFFIVDIFLKTDLSPQKLLLSLIAWDEIGNSNWYMFAIFFEYIVLMLSFFIKDENKQFGFIMILNLVYFIVISTVKDAYWVNTIFCFPAGLLFSKYKDKINSILNNYYLKSLIISLIVFSITKALIFVLKDYLYIYTINSMAFISLLVVISSRVRIQSKILTYLGERTFFVYILQRIPMMIFANKINYNISFLICFLITLLLSEIIYRMVNIKKYINNKNKNRKRTI